MTTEDLGLIRGSCFIPDEFGTKLVGPQGRVHNPPIGWLGVYEKAMKVDLHFPLHTFIVKLLDRYALSLAQIVPNSWHYIIGFLSLCNLHGRRLTVSLFRACFSLKRNPRTHKWWYISLRSNQKLLFGVPSSTHGWEECFFLIFVEQPWGFETTWCVPRIDQNRRVSLVREEEESFVYIF